MLPEADPSWRGANGALEIDGYRVLVHAELDPAHDRTGRSTLGVA
jgi:hypothetical protein